MEFFHRGPEQPGRLGILAGTFNPPTRAHLVLAESALHHVDEVVWVLPRVLPHKHQHGATFDERIQMLCHLAANGTRQSVAAAQGGLFLEIARECRTNYGAAELLFVCGRDAAQRVMEWDYGQAGVVDRMLSEFQLLVAGRDGHYQPSGRFASRIHRLTVAASIDPISSTDVRDRIRLGEPWEHLVPEAIVEDVTRIYARASGALL